MFRPKVALFAVMLLGVVGLGASCHRTQSTTGGTGASVQPESSESGHTAPAANTAGGSDITQLPGLDLAALSTAERETFWAVANDELSPCGDPHSIAVCARDHTCTSCMPALRFLAHRVQDGFPRNDLGELVRARYSRSAVVTINTDDSPTRGPATAPVTIVEFTDYECPHCGHAAPIMRDIEQEFHDRVRLVHMHFPLSGHIHAAAAARAAVAAGKQGKFWEYHDLLFQNQHALEQADLERYATQLGLDLNRFRADMQSPETEAKVAADRREGERLQIDGTPTIFINGRKYVLPVERAQLREWIQEELDAPAPH